MIWVIAGTADGRKIAQEVYRQGFKIIVTTATDYGKSLFGSRPEFTISAAAMDKSSMMEFIRHNRINAIVDASHPYAVGVSKNAMAAVKECAIRYYRYERPSVTVKKAVMMPDYPSAVRYLKGTTGNILLTVGSKYAGLFGEIEACRLFLRILPTTESIRRVEEAGFRPDRIIALQGIFSQAFHRALLKEYDIRYLVTKDSGIEGGLPEKTAAAQELDTEVILIARPPMSYPEIYTDIGSLLRAIEEIK